jgi:hypothetical protein
VIDGFTSSIKIRQTQQPVSWKWVTALLTAVFLAYCGPTYPKDRVVESLVSLCQEESHLPVQAVITETTIGVRLSVNGLFEDLPEAASGVDLKRLAEGPQFSKQALEAIEDVSLALRRVIMSTDAPLEFYTVVTRDIPTGVELIWSGYITDLKRLNYLDISQGDFLRYRTPVSLRLEPERVARQAVDGFLKDLTVRPVAQLFARYVSHAAVLEQIMSVMLRLVTEGVISGSPLQWDLAACQVSSKEVLVYASFHRVPPPAPSGSQGRGSDGRQPVAVGHPSEDPGLREGGTAACLFLVETDEIQGLIRQMEWLTDPQIVPPQYRSLGPPATWEDRFYVEPLFLPQFLADQIVRRIRVNLASGTADHQPSWVEVAGAYRDKRFDFQFHVLSRSPGIERGPVRTPQPQSQEDLASAIVQTAAEVFHSYRFTDFQEFRVSDALKGTRWVVPAKELPLYRRRQPPALQPFP